jgi:hypothetical protein
VVQRVEWKGGETRERCTTTRLAEETLARPQMREVEAGEVEVEVGEVVTVSEWPLVAVSE